MKQATCDVSSCFLCSHCIPEWKEVIGLHKKTFSFRKGETIFLEGEKVNGIYFMYSGAAKVHKRWGQQKDLILRFVKAGDILGHRGLGPADTYPVTATALTESKACFITAEFLETTFRVDPGFTHRLMQFYSAELQKAELRMRNLALMEVRSRVAETLLELLQVYGRNKEHHISVPVTRQDIAAYAGTTYETVFKFLKSLSAAKIISVAGKSIRINAEAKLRKMVKEGQ